MTEAIGDELDEGRRFLQLLEDVVDDLEILQFGIGADVVDFAGGAFQQDGEDGAAMIVDVDPIADVQAVAVDREGSSASARVIMRGMSFSGNWNGP